jgi:hypothetical protein
VSKEPTDASRIRSVSRGDAGSYPPSPRGNLDTRVERPSGCAHGTTGVLAIARGASVCSTGLGRVLRSPPLQVEPGDLATLCDGRAVEANSCLECPVDQNKSFRQYDRVAPRDVLSNQQGVLPGRHQPPSCPVERISGLGAIQGLQPPRTRAIQVRVEGRRIRGIILLEVRFYKRSRMDQD